MVAAIIEHSDEPIDHKKIKAKILFFAFLCNSYTLIFQLEYSLYVNEIMILSGQFYFWSCVLEFSYASVSTCRFNFAIALSTTSEITN